MIVIINLITAIILIIAGIACFKVASQEPQDDFGYRHKKCMTSQEKWTRANLLAGVFSITFALIFFLIVPVIILLLDGNMSVQLITYFISIALYTPTIIFIPGEIASRTL